MRKYKEFEIVTGWDYSESYGESVDYPVYTTVYEDVETGLLVTNRLRFEKWWPNRANTEDK